MSSKNKTDKLNPSSPKRLDKANSEQNKSDNARIKQTQTMPRDQRIQI